MYVQYQSKNLDTLLFLTFLKEVCYAHQAIHLFDQKYRKNSNIVK